MKDNSYQPATTQTRRQMLGRLGAGFGTVALTSLLADLHASETSTRDPNLASATTHHPPRARRVIFLFMHGGPSQVDTFDHKPMLDKYDGKAFPGKLPRSPSPLPMDVTRRSCGVRLGHFNRVDKAAFLSASFTPTSHSASTICA